MLRVAAVEEIAKKCIGINPIQSNSIQYNSTMNYEPRSKENILDQYEGGGGEQHQPTVAEEATETVSTVKKSVSINNSNRSERTGKGHHSQRAQSQLFAVCKRTLLICNKCTRFAAGVSECKRNMKDYMTDFVSLVFVVVVAVCFIMPSVMIPGTGVQK